MYRLRGIEMKWMLEKGKHEIQHLNDHAPDEVCLINFSLKHMFHSHSLTI
jgi:hypothetical protein